uniref:Uncharacterized protein n=1 Tax=Vombatus ursinus TaxID=29139 RepID=A0A4X2LJT2_VOMUR
MCFSLQRLQKNLKKVFLDLRSIRKRSRSPRLPVHMKSLLPSRTKVNLEENIQYVAMKSTLLR